MMRLILIIVGFTSLSSSIKDVSQPLSDGSILFNYGLPSENSSEVNILYADKRDIETELGFICENNTAILTATTFRTAMHRCQLKNLEGSSDVSHLSENWTWINNFSFPNIALGYRYNLVDNCKKACTDCDLIIDWNRTAIAVRYLLVSVSDLPDTCIDGATRTTSKATIQTFATFPNKDLRTEYFWIAIGLSISVALICVCCVMCVICRGSPRKKSTVIQYASPSDIVRSVPSEYSTPYDARSSQAGILAVKAKQSVIKPNQRSFRNPFKKIYSTKRNKKKPDHDSGYSEIDTSRVEFNRKSHKMANKQFENAAYAVDSEDNRHISLNISRSLDTNPYADITDIKR